MGACETTPPATRREHQQLPPHHQHARILPRSRWSAAARQCPDRSSSPLRSCGRSSWTPPAQRR